MGGVTNKHDKKHLQPLIALSPGEEPVSDTAEPRTKGEDDPHDKFHPHEASEVNDGLLHPE